MVKFFNERGLSGLPLCSKHPEPRTAWETVQVGRITGHVVGLDLSFYVFAEIYDAEIAKDVRSGRLRSLSLNSAYLENRKRGERPSCTFLPVEVTITDDPLREGCNILFHWENSNSERNRKPPTVLTEMHIR